MKRSDLIFISGPFSGTLPIAVEQNIVKALDASLFCIEHGAAFFCPNLLGTYPSMRSVPYAAFLAWVLDIMLPQCKLLVLLPDWEKSPGCVEELARAEKLGIPVMAWARYRSLVLTGVAA